MIPNIREHLDASSETSHNPSYNHLVKITTMTIFPSIYRIRNTKVNNNPFPASQGKTVIKMVIFWHKLMISAKPAIINNHSAKDNHGKSELKKIISSKFFFGGRPVLNAMVTHILKSSLYHKFSRLTNSLTTVVSEKKGTFICELRLERYIYLRNTQEQLKITSYVRNKSFLEFYLVYNGVCLKLLGSLL